MGEWASAPTARARQMVSAVLVLVAGVVHASAHKFLDSGDAGERLVTDAAEQKLELGKFFDEVSSEASMLQKELNEEKAKNAELQNIEKKAVGELKHAKGVFAEELHKVETRVASKVSKLTKSNENLKEDLSRAKLSVVLHEKTEDALRQSLGQISKVFQSQQAAVQNIIQTTSDVDNKLQSQDAKAEVPKAEKVEKVVEAKVEDAADVPDVADDAKVEDSAKDTAADDAPADDAPKDDAPKVDADAEVEQKEAPDAQSTTVSLAHAHAARKPVPKADDLDLDDKPKEAPAKNDMDSIKAEVDALDKEVDDTPATPATDDTPPAIAAVEKPDSASMLSTAGDALNKLLKQ